MSDPRKPMGRSKIEYIRQDIPSVSIPPWQGQSYEDLVPDTLDIAERIELAVNGVTGPTDPEIDCEIYFWANFFHQPPVMTHDFSDWCTPKFMEALPLLRLASGSQLNSNVDEAWKDALLRSIGPDGLHYLPMKGGTWYRTNLPDLPVFQADGSTLSTWDEAASQLSAPSVCGRLISAMTVYYLRDGNPVWKGIIEKMVPRLAEIAVDRGDYCFYPTGFYAPNARISADPGGSPAENMVDWGGARLIEGLSRYYRVTGFEPAIALAGRLVKTVRYHAALFDAEGVFVNQRAYTAEGQAALGTGEVATAPGGHFHSHTIALLNLLEYALAVRDQELLDFVRKSYEWARLQGSTLTGFFPTVINPQVDPEYGISGLPYSGILSPWYDEFEICELADMIALALKLSAGGVGDYYPDAERWARNYFAEGQLTRIDWIRTRPRYMDTRPIFPNETSDRVPERCLGGFGGWLSGSDWATRMGLMHCCTGNATRTLYYLWEQLVTREEGALKVNLLLNHASPWVDVHSYTPYEGRVDLRIKERCERVLIHAPEWVDGKGGQLQVRVGDELRAVSWHGRYVDAGPARPGDTVVMTFPQQEYMIKEQMGDNIYVLTMKDNTVVEIDPPGRHCPLFQRAHYRENQVRWRRVKRFVPETRIHW